MLLAGLGVIAWQTLRQREIPEPLYKGKPISHWINLYGDGRAIPIQEFESTWREMGTNAIPVLVKALGRHDNVVQKAYRVLWPKLPGSWQKRLPRPVNPYWIQERAIEALQAIGQIPDAAIPTLIHLVKVDQNRQAVSALGQLALRDPAATQALVEALKDKNPEMRGDVALALGFPGRDPTLVVPALMNCLHDPTPTVCAVAASSLSQYGSHAKEAVPSLVELLKDHNPTVHSFAAAALLQIDPEAAAKAGVK